MPSRKKPAGLLAPPHGKEDVLLKAAYVHGCLTREAIRAREIAVLRLLGGLQVAKLQNAPWPIAEMLSIYKYTYIHTYIHTNNQPTNQPSKQASKTKQNKTKQTKPKQNKQKREKNTRTLKASNERMVSTAQICPISAHRRVLPVWKCFRRRISRPAPCHSLQEMRIVVGIELNC